MTRNYRKSIKFYIRNVFKKWKPTTWIFFILTVLALVGGGRYYIGQIYVVKNIISAPNSTFDKSPIIQGSSNVDITYTEIETDPDVIPPAYTKSLMLTYIGGHYRDTVFNLKNVKVKLETGQELFLKNYPYNIQVHAAYTDKHHSSYFIPPKTRLPADYKECFKLEFYDEGGDDMWIGKDFVDNEECYERVNGTDDFATYWNKGK